ncbi:MAG: response regulator transcription factor [Vagococcus sp.]|uniref:response regulator transcription factor n=1 Tax=Vagococcus TaxID=2737 RepID=UPI002FCA40F7
MLILLVEDDERILAFLEPLLKKEGYDLLHAGTIEQADIYLRTYPIDLILLDLGLPDKDGLEFLADFRSESDTPLIVISARSDEETKVRALDLNADDYLTKPFGSQELLARIRTTTRHYRKATKQTEENMLRNGDLVLDTEKHQVILENEQIHLTKNEYLLLKVLMENKGKVLTHDFLSKAVWGMGSMNPLTLRVNLSNVRKKIEKNPLEATYIQTEIGVGYRMVDLD